MPIQSYFRTTTAIAQRYAQIFPILSLAGPRQSGKTTLAKQSFPHLPYVSFEDLDAQATFTRDPRKFLEMYNNGAIFDEVQHVPTLFSYLQGVVDASNATGRFVLTSSQNFLLNQKITQSLAGRVGLITLLPLSIPELDTKKTSLERIFLGGYPRLHVAGMLPHEFYPSYISSYIERDVRQLQNVENLSLFQTFMKLCAGRTGQLLNLDSLAQDCGIAHGTARQWLTILEASYVVFLLRPYHTNFNKRLTKMPKLYFYDTGVATSLLGINSLEQLSSHYAKGSLFENFAITEVLKARLNRGLQPQLYFWRDSLGREIDLIDEWGGTTHLFECKSGFTFNTDDAKNLEYFSKLMPQAQRFIVYGAPQLGVYGDIKLITLEELDPIIAQSSPSPSNPA